MTNIAWIFCTSIEKMLSGIYRFPPLLMSSPSSAGSRNLIYFLLFFFFTKKDYPFPASIVEKDYPFPASIVVSFNDLFVCSWSRVLFVFITSAIPLLSNGRPSLGLLPWGFRNGPWLAWSAILIFVMKREDAYALPVIDTASSWCIFLNIQTTDMCLLLIFSVMRVVNGVNVGFLPVGSWIVWVGLIILLLTEVSCIG